MQLPTLQSSKADVTMLGEFRGYNHNLRINEGEFYDMENLTMDYYPLMAPRSRRGIIEQLENPSGLLGANKLIYIENDKLYINRDCACELEHSDKERQLVMMGSYIVIFPDKVMYSTETEQLENLETFVTLAAKPKFTLCKMDGTVFDAAKTYTGTEEPDKTTYKYWIDTSENTVTMKIYSENTSAWVSVGTTYVKVSATGIGKGFSKYDAVAFSGVDKNENIYNDYDFNTSNILYEVSDDYVVIVGFINKTFTNSKVITLKREVPDMDFVAELDNRIWGCSSDKHEIYSCKQGDPKNWNCFMGLTSDSYAATVGSDGPFTGCVNYLGSIIFFKERGIHKVYGEKPSNFQLSWRPMRGVQYGSEKSLVVLNEYLYYKSRDGICIYSGGEPTELSAPFGGKYYYDAVAGGFRDKYYISMRDEDYQWHMFVYDASKQMVAKEDNTMAKWFGYSGGGLYLINSKNVLQVINSEKIYTTLFPMMDTMGDEYCYPSDKLYPNAIPSGELEDKISWYGITGEIGLDSPYEKYIRRLIVRLNVEKDAHVRFEIMYDSSGKWENLMEYVATIKRSYSIPLKVQRCDHLQLRISGQGDVKIYSIAKEIEQGSEMS